MRKIAVLLALVASLTLPVTATGASTDTHLNAVVSVFAMRSVSAICYEEGEKGHPDEYGAYGYVLKPVAKAKAMHVAGDLCAAAAHVNDTAISQRDRALGVLVLVHEAYHLRRWSAAANEAKVECKAIRHWKVGARMLGATPETVAGLWAEALVLHYEVTQIVDWRSGERPYYDQGCVVPPLWEPPE